MWCGLSAPLFLLRLICLRRKPSRLLLLFQIPPPRPFNDTARLESWREKYNNKKEGEKGSSAPPSDVPCTHRHKMFRLRRYRVFVACAVFLVFLLYRVSLNSGWESDFQSQYVSAVLPDVGRKIVQSELPAKPAVPHQLPADNDEQKAIKIPELKTDDKATAIPAESEPNGKDANAAPAPAPPPPADVPDRQPGNVADVFATNNNNNVDIPLHIQKPPGRVDPDKTVNSPVHWTPMPEHFPVPEGELIPLPTGKPKSIPTIQHKFGAETEEAKTKREGRLAQIKAEMKRAWDTYSLYAFGHDELVPVSLGYADPFGGWGATLVDSLDTLWIMGMKDEFDTAYAGLERIDFTTTPRNDIPVFETTIRYLGGFLAAYDVTGGHKGNYPLLLKKAVELAEVLMGVFDTPNRMPVLYYNWKPAFASQPKRASVRAGVAEFGTLSMEFTRLAQLTGQDKYYDAVARITDALDEWQNREDDTAPLLAGIFPENIDAAGCNNTAPVVNPINSASSLAQQQVKTAPQDGPQGYAPKKPGMELRDDARLDPAGGAKKATKRDVVEPPSVPAHSPADTHWSTAYKPGSSRGPSHDAHPPPLAANGLPANWDCVAQNLTASMGIQNYGMGGSQDSAYEYFPKQYLLLGGLEAKYRSLHEKTVAAVKKHLLFRPMVEDEADILFSAKAKVSIDPSLTLPQRTKREYEVTHLTCFLGGMFAMGAKIFDSEEDLEVGRRLTDGCVWAYSSMPAGIMAEYAQITPCADAAACPWNETAWHLLLDPSPDWRDSQMSNYEERLALWRVEKQQVLRAEAERQQAEEEMALREKHIAFELSTGQQPSAMPGSPVTYGGAKSSKDVPSSAQDPQAPSKRDLDPVSGDTLAVDPSALDQKAIAAKVRKLEAEFDNADGTPSVIVEPLAPVAAADSYGGTVGQVPINQVAAKARANPNFKVPYKPAKPLTHLEFVQQRIASESLPGGYTAIGSNSYQLR